MSTASFQDREETRLILASASASRAAMLTNAGLTFSVEPSTIDEAPIKREMTARGAAVAEVAERLAREKALDVAGRNPGALVLGADQMLDCGGKWLDKPADRAGAAEHLRLLRGRTHHLVTSAVVVRDDQVLWHHFERAEMSMRELSDAFVDRYLDEIGDDACRSVGAYQLEGRGAQLFDRVAGDFFVVLGLPLLPLLGFLRREGVLQR